MQKLLFVSLVAMLTGSCGPRIQVTNDTTSLTPRDEQCSARIYREHDPIERAVEEVGDVSIGDTGFTTNCGSRRMFDELRRQTCLSGADAARVVRVRQADLMSSCVRIEARLLRYADTTASQ